MLSDRLSSLDRRLAKVGLPLLLSNAVLLGLPILARAYLGPIDYATWALLMTVVVSAFLFDLGGTAYIQSAGYGVWVGRRLYAQSVGLATLGVVVVTAAALLTSLLLRDSLSITTEPVEFVVLLCATGFGAGVRSTFSVMLTRLQVSEEFTLRTRLIVVQSFAQVAIAWAALALGAGLWALPGSLVLSVAPLLAVAHHALARRRSTLPMARPPTRVLGFASVRTLSAVLATTSSQADRWVLAAIAPATFLTNYDLALRIASLPLSLVITLFGGLIAEAADVRGGAAHRRLVRASTKRLGAILTVSSGLGFGVVLLALSFGAPIVTSELTLILAMALVWQGANALTAPTTFTFIGVGKPANEFRYTVPVVLCTAIGWAAAASLAEPWIVPVATLISVSTWSVWFVYYGTRVATY